MRYVNAWIVGLLIVGALVTACSSSKAVSSDESDAPATLEEIEGSSISRVVLSEEAADRLQIETTPVVVANVTLPGSETVASRMVVPYGAVLYDVDGAAYAYTSPEPRTYVRAPMTIDFIDGDRAVLSDGPPVGTEVVTVGAAELFGAEFDFGE